MTVTQPIQNIQHIPTTQLTAMVTWLNSITPLATGSRAPLLTQLAAELAKRTAEHSAALQSIVHRPLGYVAVRDWRA